MTRIHWGELKQKSLLLRVYSCQLYSKAERKKLKRKSKLDKNDKYMVILLFLLSYLVYTTSFDSHYHLQTTCIIAKIKCPTIVFTPKVSESTPFNIKTL